MAEHYFCSPVTRSTAPARGIGLRRNKFLAHACWLLAASLTGSPVFAQDPPPLKPGLYAVFTTEKGQITAQLFEKDVPHTVHTFVALAQGVQPWLDPETHQPVKRPLYENLTFHRVLPGVMIQSGDPTGKGNHNCGFRIKDEFLPGLLFNQTGRLAMANTGTADSGGCQFFLTASPMPDWNGRYAVFGQVVRGQNVVEAISRAPVKNEKPVSPVTLKSVSIIRVGPVPAVLRKK